MAFYVFRQCALNPPSICKNATGTSKILEKKLCGLFDKTQGVNRKGTYFSILYLGRKLNQAYVLMQTF